jgi:hypothetical protein
MQKTLAPASYKALALGIMSSDTPIAAALEPTLIIAHCSCMEQYLCTMPKPPISDMTADIVDSVTVSIGLDMMGKLYFLPPN